MGVKNVAFRINSNRINSKFLSKLLITEGLDASVLKIKFVRIVVWKLFHFYYLLRKIA